MSAICHELEKTTQTDLLYGMSVDGGVAVLERDDRGACEPLPSAVEHESNDAITQNAATETDLTAAAELGGASAGGGACKKTRWRYLDGIAPRERPITPIHPQLVVVDHPWASSLELLARRTWKSSVSLLTSLLTHVLLIPLLVLLTVPVAAPALVTDLIATYSPDEPEPLVVLELTGGTIYASPLPASLERLAVPASTANLLVEAQPANGEIGRDSPAGMEVSRGPVAEVTESFGRGGPSDLPDRPASGAGGAEFFGTKAEGNKFVFVVDCSLSMQGERWLQASAELNAAIGRLRPDQLFYVVLFDGGVHRMFDQQQRDAALFPATDENKERFRQWLATVRLGYETRPLLSVKCALELGPDAIYLLSDGDFKDQTADYLKDVNRPRSERGQSRRRTSVHTISFHSRLGQATMRRISRENSGQHVFVARR